MSFKKNLLSNLQDYSPEISLALILFTMLCNVFLILKIKYGNMLVTKSTVTPYNYALSYMITSIVSAILKCCYHIGKESSENNWDVLHNAE